MMLERVFWDTISRKFERTFELDTDLNPRRDTGGAVRQLIRVTLEEEEEEGERVERSGYIRSHVRDPVVKIASGPA